MGMERVTAGLAKADVVSRVVVATTAIRLSTGSGRRVGVGDGVW